MPSAATSKWSPIARKATGANSAPPCLWRAQGSCLLVRPGTRPYLSPMRLTGYFATLLAALPLAGASAGHAATALAVVPAATPAVTRVNASPAAAPAPARVWSPVPIGRYGDWQAATHQESGQTVCYALTYATSSQPLFQGRGHVVLTVAMRPHNRDAVAILLGYSVLPHAGASVQAGGKHLHLYLEGRSAFAPHGHDAVEAFEAGKQAVGSFPGPRGLTLTDVFSLNGFAAAYAAIVKACPAP